MPDFLITVFFFFAALFPLVLIHELGHFLIAKANGIRVDEFGIGFPPRLFRAFRLGETDYTINALPLGGFVRLAGENDPDMPGAFAAAGKAARAAVLFAGPVFNFVFAALLLAGIALIVGAPEAVAPDDAVTILQVMEDSPAAEAGFVANDVVVAIDGQSLGELARAQGLAGDETTPAGMQVLMDATDAASGSPLAVTVLRGVSDTLRVDAPQAGSDWQTQSASLAGVDAQEVTAAPANGPLQVGDVLFAPRAVAQGQAPTPGQTLVVLRGEQLSSRQIEVTPEEGRIGVSIGALSAVRKLGWLEAPAYGTERTVSVMGAMVGMLGQMVTGRQEAEIAGPVGIARMSREIGNRGLTDFVAFMALLSINLGIINLVPIPGLDGGRLVFVALEALRGRRLEPSREEIVHFIGIALVIGLMLVITVYEVFGPGLVGQP
jgi:regulator of sigma E protease